MSAVPATTSFTGFTRRRGAKNRLKVVATQYSDIPRLPRAASSKRTPSVFCRPAAPCSSSTRALGTPKARAAQSISAALALPSTGGAPSRTRKAPA